MKESPVSHDLFMHECIALARLARQRGDSPVAVALYAAKVWLLKDLPLITNFIFFH